MNNTNVQIQHRATIDSVLYICATLCFCLTWPTSVSAQKKTAPETISSGQTELVLYICDPSQLEIQNSDEKYVSRDFDRLLDQINSKLDTKMRFEYVELDAIDETITQSILRSSFAGCILPRNSISQDTKTSLTEIARLDSEEFFDGQRIVFVVPDSDAAQTILDIDEYQIEIANPTKTYARLIRGILERLKIDNTELVSLSEAINWQTEAAEKSPEKSTAVALLEAEWRFLQKCESSPVTGWRMIGQTEELGPLVFFEPNDRDAESRRRLVSALTLIDDLETLSALKSKSGFLKTDDESVLERLRAQFDQ